MSETEIYNQRKRIWELDALRGFFILCVIIIHLIYDLEYFKGLKLPLPDLYYFIQYNGGILFIIISGICITLGRRSLKRGLLVLFFGMVISLVTYLSFPESAIYFGILHLLGLCMIMYPLYKKLPLWSLLLISSAIIGIGFYIDNIYVKSPYLFMFGLITETFVSSDYFPLFPNLGFFMLGIVLGRTIYINKTSLIPNINTQNPIIRFLCFCGRHSIWIYLIHQPIIYLFIEYVL